MDELREKIERVKRSTRNSDILDICDALEARLGKAQEEAFNKKIYMRLYMRKYRKKVPLLEEANPFD